MAKPVCKSEARWIFWREEGRWLYHHPGKFTKWMKTAMRRARRWHLRRDVEMS